MITFRDCVFLSKTRFRLGDGANLCFNNTKVYGAETVFNIPHKNVSVNVNVNNMIVENSGVYIMVGDSEKSVIPLKGQPSRNQYLLPPINDADEVCAIMKIAFQYLNSVER